MAIKSALLTASLLFAAHVPFASAGDMSSIEGIVTSDHRTPSNVARDAYRHPVETLTFFAVKPDMNVAEIWPSGSGYYAEILAPFVAKNGEYTAVVATLHATSEYQKTANKDLFTKFAKYPFAFGKVKLADITKGDYVFAEAGSLDMIFTFRNLHNWVMGNYQTEMLQAFYAALKPGGRVAVVDHRLDGSPHEGEQVWNGYVSEAKIKDLFEGAGFKFVAKSDVNANPKDTKDYEKGVWTLPPTLTLGDLDKSKYLAIGESDRATMMFEKPAS